MLKPFLDRIHVNMVNCIMELVTMLNLNGISKTDCIKEDNYPNILLVFVSIPLVELHTIYSSSCYGLPIKHLNL